MASIKAVAIGLLTLFFASGTDSDPIAVLTVPATLHSGQGATISYFNPDRAGDKIVVEIDDGGLPTPKKAFLTIQLDDNGEGSAVWSVPTDWDAAAFNAPDAKEEARPIQNG